MTNFVHFAILGLAAGAIYALIAQGTVLVYRSSGLLSFAQTALLLVGAFAYYEFREHAGLPTGLAVLLAVAGCAVVGAGVHLVILRPMRRSSPLSRVIASLGILAVVYAAAVIRYGQDLRSVPSILPTRSVTVLPDITVGLDRLLILVICGGLSLALWAGYRFTSFGRVSAAVAEGELAASTLGHSPVTVAAVNWGLSGALAGFAGVLIAPITYLEPTTLGINLIVFPLAAALVAGFRSFPLCLAAAWLIGVAQAEIGYYVHTTGAGTAAPFILVILVLVVRGRGIPLRGTVIDRLPAVGAGRVRVIPLAVAYVVVTALIFSANFDWSIAITVTVANAIICLSVVVVTGYAGQLSLAQYVLAGVGALVAARLAPHVPFLVVLLVAALSCVLVGVVVGIPAIRTRGVSLSVVTLGVGVSVTAIVLNNGGWTGGQAGLLVPPPAIFGWSIDPLFKPSHYAFVAFTILMLLCVGVANLRRGITGRRLIAVRSNERAAASLGVNVPLMKCYAFAVAAGIAGIGGVLLAFVQSSVTFAGFSVFESIAIVGLVVVGGIGNTIGAIMAAMLMAGGVTSQILDGWSDVNLYLPLIGGVLLLLNLRFAPDGIATITAHSLAPLTRRWDAAVARLVRRRDTAVVPAPAHAEPKRLVVTDLSVSFGGVKALDGVSMEVSPGHVHGLLGPNGAGKTTFIDAVTGFVPARGGSVTLGESGLDGLRPGRRAHLGLARAFQSLELFNDLTVRENIAVACETRRRWRWLTDVVRPGRVVLTPAAASIVQRLELTDLLDLKPGNISYGARKLVAIARAVAGVPSVLLLDEPAAGLDDAEADHLAGLIRQLAREWGIGVLLIDHKIDLVLSVSDQVTVIANGALLASGTPDDIRTDTKVVDAYLGVSDPAADPVPAS